MKKFSVIICIFLVLFCSMTTSCKKNEPLLSFVSDLREDVFVGENEDFSLKAYNGKREEPFIKDGKVGLVKPRLNVKIISHFNDFTEVKGVIEYNQTSYTEVFTFNPVSNLLDADFNIESFNPKTFDITLYYLDKSSTITLTSIKPQNTLSIEDALGCLRKNQPTLVENNFNESSNAEIFVRLLVEKEKPYYYIGIATDKKVIAFLIDGINGEVLSIKEVF